MRATGSKLGGGGCLCDKCRGSASGCDLRCSVEVSLARATAYRCESDEGKEEEGGEEDEVGDGAEVDGGEAAAVEIEGEEGRGAEGAGEGGKGDGRRRG